MWAQTQSFHVLIESQMTEFLWPKTMRDAGSHPTTMAWYKPLSGRDPRESTMAILLMNNGDAAAPLSFKLEQVPGMKGARACKTYSVWEQKSLGQLEDGHVFANISSRGSVFLTLSGCEL